MEKFITEQDKELLPWLHITPIVKTIEQSLISSIKLGFARESIKEKLAAIATATTTGIFKDEIKFIEKKILALIKDNDDTPTTTTLIKKTFLKLEKTKLQNKERDLITKQDQTKTELETTLETLITKRHPQVHHPKGTWTETDENTYRRITDAYRHLITASYDHRQLLHQQKKQLKKLAFEKKQEEDNALLQLTRKDLNQTIATSIKAFMKNLKTKSPSPKTKSLNSRPNQSKNGKGPVRKTGPKSKQPTKTLNQRPLRKEKKRTTRKNKNNAGGATKN